MVNIGGLTECQHGTPGPGSWSSLPDVHTNTRSDAPSERKRVPASGSVPSLSYSLGLQMIHVPLIQELEYVRSK